MDCEGCPSVVTRSVAEEDTLDSNDDFFTGRDRAKVLLKFEVDAVGEDVPGPSNRVGLGTGDSVMTAPVKDTLLGPLEGGLSPVSCVEDDVRERGWGETTSSVDADDDFVVLLLSESVENEGRGRGRTPWGHFRRAPSRLLESESILPSRADDGAYVGVG